MKAKFKKRYVLGIGIPNLDDSFVGLLNHHGFDVKLSQRLNREISKNIQRADEKYRIVLERVK